MDKLEVLQKIFGHESFREGQEALVDDILAGHDVLGVMPTGAGKSICYQVPALVMDGITIIVSPLISLMKDQVSALKAMGVPAAYINSSLTPRQQAEAIRRAAIGTYKLIYVAPERLLVPSFLNFAKEANITLFAVDEAHCVSQWGQDFRPSYLSISQFVEALPHRPPVAAFTATATHKVRNDIIRLLKLEEPLCLTTGFNRPNLHFASVKPTNKMAMLLQFLEESGNNSGIVYCGTRKNVEFVTSRLQVHGISAVRYHAGLSDEERRQNQEDFQYDRARIMVATNAFGMGIDKSNVRFVVHYNMPMNLENYYQEAGRAGRDGKSAECLLLYSGEDYHMQKWMIEHREENPELTEEQREELQKLDEERLKQMVFYATSKSCLRNFILRYFGEYSEEENCGNCSVCENAPFEMDTGSSRKSRNEIAAAMQKEEKVLTREHGKRLRMNLSDGFTAWERAAYENLKELRKLLARYESVPAYIIFSDMTLEDMVRKHPTDEESFLAVSGVGDLKCERYSQVFLNVIRDGREPNEAFADYRSEKERPIFISEAAEKKNACIRRLIALRALFAKGEKKSPDSVFSRDVLEQIADECPKSRKELSSVAGFSNEMIQKYGDAILLLLEGDMPPEKVYETWLKKKG